MTPNSPPLVTTSASGSTFVGIEPAGPVVWVQGEHDISTVGELSDTIARAIELDGSDLVVDLSGVVFMSAAALGVIVTARERLRERSRSMTVRAPSRCAQRVLEVSGQADLIDPSPAAAVFLTAV